MTTENAVIGAIADVANIVINGTLKAMGYSEIESKKVQSICQWFLIGSVCALLIAITLIYS